MIVDAVLLSNTDIGRISNRVFVTVVAANITITITDFAIPIASLVRLPWTVATETEESSLPTRCERGKGVHH